MHSGSHNYPKEEAGGKIFPRLLSKETSLANSSCRVLYYGGASGAVPFTWESQPGTPKHTLSDQASLPPLTPPPSYYSKSFSNSLKNSSKPNLLCALFPKLSPRKALVSSVVVAVVCFVFVVIFMVVVNIFIIAKIPS
jgi:hypothetical protein